MGIDRDAVERSRAGMAAVLATVPLAGFRWRRDGGETALGQLPGSAPALSYDRFLAGLDRADAGRIDAAVAELRRIGTGFAATASTTAGTTYDIQGGAAANG